MTYLGELHPGSGTGIVGLWHLNGNSNDSSGNGNNLTDTSVSYGLSYGKFGQGAYFNGSAVSSKATTLGLANNGAVSFLAWFKRESSSATGSIVGHTINPGGSQARTVWMSVYGDADIRLLIYTNAYYNIQSTTTSLGTNWHFIGATLDGNGNSKLFLNGELVKSGTYTNTPSDTPATNFAIGRRPEHSSEFFTGSIDEVVAFNRALSASEIRKIYAVAMGKYY